MDAFVPGDEYELVDEYAHQLKLRHWYEWRPDSGPATSAGDESSASVAPPLTTDRPEAYTYCLDALKRFDGKGQ
jgi:hypothetical protein